MGRVRLWVTGRECAPEDAANVTAFQECQVKRQSRDSGWEADHEISPSPSDRPERRLGIIAANRVEEGSGPSQGSTIRFTFDIREDSPRVVLAPGQAVSARLGFNVAYGLASSRIEQSVFDVASEFSPAGPVSRVSLPVSAFNILQACIRRELEAAKENEGFQFRR